MGGGLTFLVYEYVLVRFACAHPRTNRTPARGGRGGAEGQLYGTVDTGSTHLKRQLKESRDKTAVGPRAKRDIIWRALQSNARKARRVRGLFPLQQLTATALQRH